MFSEKIQIVTNVKNCQNFEYPLINITSNKFLDIFCVSIMSGIETDWKELEADLNKFQVFIRRFIELNTNFILNKIKTFFKDES